MSLSNTESFSAAGEILSSIGRLRSMTGQLKKGCREASFKGRDSHWRMAEQC